MIRRSLATALLIAACVPAFLGQAAQAGTPAPAFQPDAWIKLCGQSLGCTINPPPHPWLGRNRYNTTGFKQTVHQKIDNGEGVRYWIEFQNDGTQPDTFKLRGCAGTQKYEVHSVAVGFWKGNVGPHMTEVFTDKFIHNTWTVDLGPGEKIGITLNIITHGVPGPDYRCPVRITSTGDPTASDTVAATIDMF